MKHCPRTDVSQGSTAAEEARAMSQFPTAKAKRSARNGRQPDPGRCWGRCRRATRSFCLFPSRGWLEPTHPLSRRQFREVMFHVNHAESGCDSRSRAHRTSGPHTNLRSTPSSWPHTELLAAHRPFGRTPTSWPHPITWPPHRPHLAPVDHLAHANHLAHADSPGPHGPPRPRQPPEPRRPPSTCGHPCARGHPGAGRLT